MRYFLFASLLMLALLANAPSALGQEYVSIFESRSFPLQNRVRDVYIERDLRARAYRIFIRPYTRVTDNLDEVIARRSPETFKVRFHRSRQKRQSIYDMYDQLSH